MSEELIPEPFPLEEQISVELVKHNYTEAKLQEFKEYLSLDIVDDDKESYLIIKDKRKEVKAYRVAVEKFCKYKREDAVKIQKAWVSKENELVAEISKVEDYLEAKEKAYEKKLAEEKEAKKRKQEEQLIMRQQALTGMGALYSDGKFILGTVSFELSVVKESDEDIWLESILPNYQKEYDFLEADRIKQEQLKQEREAELKRQQEELEQKQKELAEKEAKLKEESDRQAAESAKKIEGRTKSRLELLASLGFVYDGIGSHVYRSVIPMQEDAIVPFGDVKDKEDDVWRELINNVSNHVFALKKEEAEEKRKEQERVELQNKRYAELLPYKDYGDSVEMDVLWMLSEENYDAIMYGKMAAYNKHEEEKAKEIADKAAKAERERIAEEQRKAEVTRKYELRKARMSMLVEHDLKYHGDFEVLGEISEEVWIRDFNEIKSNRDEIIRKQEEERKTEELAKAGDKEKWNEIMERVEAIEVYAMRSSQYRKKAAILREKLEEIKAL